MSVLVKGMEMPKGCFFCPMRIKIDPDTIRCLATGNDFEETLAGTIERRNNGNCPLVEVKEPHGRLIDADELNIHDISPVDGFCVMGVTEEEIGVADAVIEAEGSDT